MKEKIWIEKLIKLLNEYETPRSWVVYKSYDDYDWFFYWVDCDWETEIAWSDSLICSKKFWRIWRLIENKKLKSYRAYRDFISQNYVEFENWAVIPSVNWQLYDSVLCWLAIQDEPIRFLCEILK